MNVVYVTGNDHKAAYFSKMVGIDIPHQKIDVEEMQSLDLRAIVEHKVRQAYDIVKRPVLVEDTKLSFNALGALPGPFIKFFLEEIGLEGLCRLLDSFEERGAVAGAAIAYYDGSILEIFESELGGTIASKPSGEQGFGWNHVFIPDGSSKTLGDMDEAGFQDYYGRIKPFSEVAKFLHSLDKA